MRAVRRWIRMSAAGVALGATVLPCAARAPCPVGDLTSPLVPLGAEFGRAVALHAQIAVVGAPLEDVPGAVDAGAAYVFRFDAGQWTQEARLVAADPGANDQFGRSARVFGDVAVIGAPFDDDQGADSGSVYIFRRSQGGAWIQEAKLRAIESGPGDQFGISIGYEGVFAIIGAPGHDKNGLDAGAAYLFAPNQNAQWVEERQLLAPDGLPGDQYGRSVACDVQRFAIGAPRVNLWGPTSGVVYFGRRLLPEVVAFEGRVWPDDGATGDEFGSAVAVRGSTALIGAPFDDSDFPNAGSAYVFLRNPMFGIPWVQHSKLVSPGSMAEDRFGDPVALGLDTGVLGAAFAGADDSGRARVFLRRSSGLWQPWSLLGEPDPASGALFGFGIAADASLCLVGAPVRMPSGVATVFDLSRRPGDANGDGNVDFIDLNAVLSDYGLIGGMLAGDVNVDGAVDFLDLNLVLGSFGATCAP